ncbi:MAG TPA: hypothetical protein VGE67_13470 [Haloferula sp.]
MIAIATFAAGVGAGWWIKPAAPDTSADATPPSQALPTKTGNERPTGPDDRKRLDELLSQVTKQAHQSMFQPQKKDSDPGPVIDAADYPKLLEALQQSAGLSGLSFENKSAFGKLLGDWYAADPSRAANWVRSLKNAGDRRELGEVLVAAAVKNDYEAAVRLMQDFSVSDQGTIQVPESLMKAAAKRGAEELLKLCLLSPSQGSAMGHSISYPRDFDFRAAIQGFADSGAKGVKPSTYPSNLWDEWAKRDSEAAFRYYVESKPQGSLGHLHNYFSTLRQSASSDELASKVALALSIGGSDERMLNSLGGGLGAPNMGPGNPTLVPDMLAKLPDNIDQTGLRAALVKMTAWEGEDGSGRRDAFLRDLEPDERVVIITSIFSKKDGPQWDQPSLDSLKKTLVSLGHSAEQVKELVPDAPKQEEGSVGGVVVGGVSFGSGFVQEDEEPEESHEE